MERSDFMIPRVGDPGSSPGLPPRCFGATVDTVIFKATLESAACDVFQVG